MRKASKKCIEMIKQLEGFVGHAYKCLPSEDYYTIGYGHYGITDANMVVTREEAEELLNEDLEVVYKGLSVCDNYYLFTDNEYDALVSFCFNLGVGTISQLTDRYTRSKGQIANAIPYYNHDGAGNVVAGLTTRREAEYTLFTSGVYPDGTKCDEISDNNYDITEDTTLGEIVDMTLSGRFGDDEDRKNNWYEAIQKLVNKRYGIE